MNNPKEYNFLKNRWKRLVQTALKSLYSLVKRKTVKPTIQKSLSNSCSKCGSSKLYTFGESLPEYGGYVIKFTQKCNVCTNIDINIKSYGRGSQAKKNLQKDLVNVNEEIIVYRRDFRTF
jgi:hypothetical protein